MRKPYTRLDAVQEAIRILEAAERHLDDVPNHQRVREYATLAIAWATVGEHLADEEKPDA